MGVSSWRGRSKRRMSGKRQAAPSSGGKRRMRTDGSPSSRKSQRTHPPRSRTVQDENRRKPKLKEMVSKKSSGTRSTLNTRTSTTRSGSRSGDVWLGSTTGLEFEGVCADILEGCGFRVRRMGGTADGGRDIIMWNNRGKVVVECKHQTKPVGRPVVQKLHSAVVTEKAVGGIVIATGGFSFGRQRTYSSVHVLW